MDLKLAGKTALITGASKGIGGATAEVLAAWNPYWILDVNQELESSNPKGFFLPVDSSAKPTR